MQSDAEARYYSSFTEAITKGHIDQTYIDVNIENEIKLLQEIKDIRDELNMLSRVMSDQIDVIAKLLQWASSPHDKFDYGWDVDARRVQIKRMDEDAERVEKSVRHSTLESVRILTVTVESPLGFQIKTNQYSRGTAVEETGRRDRAAGKIHIRLHHCHRNIRKSL